MIVFPLKLESQSDAYFIRDATGVIVVDLITNVEFAKLVARALTDYHLRKKEVDTIAPS